MKTKGWAGTDVGRKRDHNEDSFLCNDGLRLYAVADGMGGHLGGERASRMAVEILEREVAGAAPAGLAGAAANPGGPDIRHFHLLPTRCCPSFSPRSSAAATTGC